MNDAEQRWDWYGDDAGKLCRDEAKRDGQNSGSSGGSPAPTTSTKQGAPNRVEDAKSQNASDASSS